MKRVPCGRFGRLLSELADREATPRETAFLERHRSVCASCREDEAAATLSLGLLRDCTFAVEVPDSFDRRILRRTKIQTVRDGFRYWSPAFTGGLVAAGLLLAAVQALTRPIAPGATRGIEANRGVQGSLALKSVPPLRP